MKFNTNNIEMLCHLLKYY